MSLQAVNGYKTSAKRLRNNQIAQRIHYLKGAEGSNPSLFAASRLTFFWDDPESHNQCGLNIKVTLFCMKTVDIPALLWENEYQLMMFSWYSVAFCLCSAFLNVFLNCSGMFWVSQREFG